MSAQNTTIAWETRYKINGTLWCAVGGDIEYRNDLANVTDSERAGARKRKRGPYEAKITVRGNIAKDVNPFVAPQLISVGDELQLVEIFSNGINFPQDIFRYVSVESFRKVLGDPDTGTPNSWELVGYTAEFTPA